LVKVAVTKFSLAARRGFVRSRVHNFPSFRLHPARQDAYPPPSCPAGIGRGGVLLGQSGRRPGCAVLHEMMLTARLPAWQELVEAGVRMAPFKISHVILNEQLYLIF
jgi:hypothetical protein